MLRRVVTAPWWPSVALAAAVLAATAMVALPLAPRRIPGVANRGPAPIPTVPPNLIVTVPNLLPDGSSYALAYVIDAGHTVGVAAAPDASLFSVVAVADGHVSTELRRLPADRGPIFNGFTLADGQLYWAETTIKDDGTDQSQLWTAPVDSTATFGSPRVLVADMGNAIFAGSAFDIIVADRTISWAATAGPPRPGTLVRSVSVNGGPISEHFYEGAWRQSTRPWLVSATMSTVALLDISTGQQHPIAGANVEQISCAPQWCRRTIFNGGDPVRLELQHSDSSQRIRLAGPNTVFATLDPALLGRYELLAQSGPNLRPGDQQLQLYDVEQQTTTIVEITLAALVNAHDGYAWWLSGDFRSPIWHVLDLRGVH